MFNAYLKLKFRFMFLKCHKWRLFDPNLFFCDEAHVKRVVLCFYLTIVVFDYIGTMRITEIIFCVSTFYDHQIWKNLIRHQTDKGMMKTKIDHVLDPTHIHYSTVSSCLKAECSCVKIIYFRAFFISFLCSRMSLKC